MPEDINSKMSKALAIWAKRNNVKPVEFQRAMGWSYNYSWRVLRGKDPFNLSSWGQFVIAYGLNALQELFKISEIDLEG